jgi:hypothetical protein
MLLAVLSTPGCDEEVYELRDDDLLDRYYPLELNRPLVYAVDSIVLTNTVGGVVYDTARLLAREVLVDTFTGADGQLMYRGERFERPTGADEYVFKQTFTVEAREASIVRSADNLSFVTLVEPVRPSTRWDPILNFDENRDVAVGGEFLDVYNYWSAQYTELHEPRTLETGVALDSVVTVELADETGNAIQLRVAYERYAAGVGLVERFIDARYTQCVVCCGGFGTTECTTASWDEKAEKGYIIRQVYVGRE